MVQQQRSKKASAAATPKVDVPDPILFFALGPAAFTDTVSVTKVVSIVLPLRHLRDRTVLHEVLLKKLLYRAYEPSADDLAQQQQQQQEPSLSREEGRAAAAAPAPTSASPRSASAAPSAPYVIVHVESPDVLADTARQVNHAGDVQVNVMAALVAARVRHGICAGVAEASPYASCMEVRVPTVRVSAAVASRGRGGGLDDAAGMALPPEDAPTSRSKTEAVGASAEGGDGGDAASAATGSAQAPRAAHSGIPERLQLRVTARCLEEEPVVPGQAVLLISEPAVMRCVAVRPPRDAPGPFSLVEGSAAADAEGAQAGGDTATSKRRGARKGRGTSAAAAAAPRRVVAIECALPERASDGVAHGAGGGAGGSKRPRA